MEVTSDTASRHDQEMAPLIDVIVKNESFFDILVDDIEGKEDQFSRGRMDHFELKQKPLMLSYFTANRSYGLEGFMGTANESYSIKPNEEANIEEVIERINQTESEKRQDIMYTVCNSEASPLKKSKTLSMQSRECVDDQGSKLCRVLKCYECSVEFNVNEKTEKLFPNGFRCFRCSCKSDSDSNLLEHGPTHAIVDLFKCSECSFECFTKKDWRKHLSTHSRKNFVCSKCDFKCDRKIKLTSHLLSRHSTAKCFKCSKCHYESNQEADLNTHMMTHSARTRWFQKHIEKIDVSEMCRMCEEKPETTSHILAGCRTLLQRGVYAERHYAIRKFLHKRICLKYGVPSNSIELWGDSPPPIIETTNATITFNCVSADLGTHQIKPDVMVKDRVTNTTYIIEIDLPSDAALHVYEKEKELKYVKLTDEIKRRWNTHMKIIPVIVGATVSYKKAANKYLSHLPVSISSTELAREVQKYSLQILCYCLGTL